MAGIGIQSAGSSSAGFGSPTRGAEEGGVILRNEKNGASYGGRKIDPNKGDYVMDENGRLVGMPNTHQLVLIAVLEAKPDLQKIDRLNDGFEREATEILNRKLAPIVREGRIRSIGVRKVRLGRGGGLAQGQAIYEYAWIDLATDNEIASEV